MRDRLRALGYVGGSPAAPRDRYGEADDPKRLIEIDALLHRAGDSYQKGQPEEAAKLFQEVIARRPDTADAYRYLAFVYWQEGRPAEAIQTLETALKQRHHSPRRPREARSLSIGDRQRRARDSPARRTGRRRHRGAERPGNRLRPGQPRRGCDQNLRACARGRSDQRPGVAEHRHRAAAVGDRGAAENSLRRALAIDDTLAGAYTTLGVVLSQTGRQPDAVAAWKRAVALNPGEFDALYNLTMTLSDLGRRDEARTYGERYVATAPPGFYGQEIARVRACGWRSLGDGSRGLRRGLRIQHEGPK